MIEKNHSSSFLNDSEKNQVNSEIRYCADIGMFATDRSIKESCKWRTSFCSNCYNNKLFKIFKGMKEKDVRNERFWETLDGDQFKSIMSKKRKSVKRFRFQTRGETFAYPKDVFKVRDILLKNPSIDFWLPTRAWRNDVLKFLIEKHIMTLPNAYVQASLDPTNSLDEWKMLKESGWSTMTYGIEDSYTTPLGDTFHRCKKTHMDIKGYCGKCENGCFSKERKDVLLKQH